MLSSGTGESIENGIQMYFHCKGCLSRNEKDKVSVGWTLKGIQIWCDNCNTSIVALDFKGLKVITDNDPKGAPKK